VSEQSKSVLLRYAEDVWNQRRLEVIEELFSPDHVSHDPILTELPRGPEGVRQKVEIFTAAFPDSHVVSNDVVADGDRVALPLDLLGHPHRRNDGDRPDRTAGRGPGGPLLPGDGKIVESRNLWNGLSFLQQLGLVRIGEQRGPGVTGTGVALGAWLGESRVRPRPRRRSLALLWRSIVLVASVASLAPAGVAAGACTLRAQADCRGASLAGANLAGVNLFGADLVGADLRDADLRGADILEADLAGARLQRANMVGIRAHLANLSGANLAGAHLVGADLHRGVLIRARLTGALMTRAYMTESSLSRANLKGATLDGATFTDADLSRVDMTGADLRRVLFHRTNLSFARLGGARMPGAILEVARLFRADLRGADLRGADLYRAVLVGADLRGADLRGANLRGAALAGVRWGRTTCPDGSVRDRSCRGR
jgi:uncharacterized protein YjbI with pentapeptide repeats